MVKPITKYVTQKRLLWYGHVMMRREDTNVAKQVTTMKVGGKRIEEGPDQTMAQTEVDGQSAERFETTPAQSKAHTEPRSMEKCSHGNRPRTGIRSAKVSINMAYIYSLNIHYCTIKIQIALQSHP